MTTRCVTRRFGCETRLGDAKYQRAARAAGAEQGQRANRQPDQTQHERRCPTDYSVARAGTTVGESQIHPAIDRGD